MQQAPAVPLASVSAPMLRPLPFANDIVAAQAGFQAGMMGGGPTYAPGYYFPPRRPYRFPSFPYDNPSYTPMQSMYPVTLPPAWRSDAFNINSDGARYLENMEKYDFY